MSKRYEVYINGDSVGSFDVERKAVAEAKRRSKGNRDYVTVWDLEKANPHRTVGEWRDGKRTR